METEAQEGEDIRYEDKEDNMRSRHHVSVLALALALSFLLDSREQGRGCSHRDVWFTVPEM